MNENLLLILLAFFFVFLNGFFVLSEFSIVKVRRSRLEELVKQGVPNAKLALKMYKQLDSYLSATQLGITLSSLALGWIGEPAVARLLEVPLKNAFGANTVLLHTVSFAIAFTFITLMHVVAGELIPKSVAIARAEKSTLFIAKPLYVFSLLFYPIIKFFENISGFFLKLMGIDAANEHETAHSEEELKLIVGESLKGGFIDSIEGDIIRNAVDFSDTQAREVMTPRKDMICLNADDSYEDNINIVRTTRHTRYPYAQGDKDKIVGMIHIRDLLENEFSDEPTHDLSKLVRDMIVVPEMASVSSILSKMNKQQIHTALIIDEYGGTAGLLTMEDIIEEIMGDISDEHDERLEECIKINDNTYEFEGIISIEEVSEILDTTFDDEYMTLGGYVFSLLGKLPEENETISDCYFKYTILEMEGTRVKRLRAERLED